MTDDELLRAAEGSLPRAVAPVSGVRVAALLLDARGTAHPGVNVENASLGLSICAERNAVFGALARGSDDFITLAVVSNSEAVLSPCGACRQILAEFAPRARVLVRTPSGAFREYAPGSLLPAPFDDGWRRDPPAGSR